MDVVKTHFWIDRQEYWQTVPDEYTPVGLEPAGAKDIDHH